MTKLLLIGIMLGVLFETPLMPGGEPGTVALGVQAG
jgi:hypothetical protein